MQSDKAKKKNKGLGNNFKECSKARTESHLVSLNAKEINQLLDKENFRELSASNVDQETSHSMLQDNFKSEDTAPFDDNIGTPTFENDSESGDETSRQVSNASGECMLQHLHARSSVDRRRDKGSCLKVHEMLKLSVKESGDASRMLPGLVDLKVESISEGGLQVNKKSKKSSACYQPLSQYRRRRKKTSFFTNITRKKNSSDSIVNADSQGTTDSQSSSLSGPPEETSKLATVASVKPPGDNLKDSPQTASTASSTKTRKKNQRPSTSAQIRKTRQGCVDLKTPNSILVNLNLKTLINKHTFAMLPIYCQEVLLKMLPECDLLFVDGSPKSNVTALSNEFFTKACMEWRERLQDGEFTYENQNKKKHEDVKESNKLDPWKAKHFETSWGDKLSENFDVYCKEESDPESVKHPQSTTAVAPQASTMGPISSNLRSSARLKNSSLVDSLKKKPESAPSGFESHAGDASMSPHRAAGCSAAEASSKCNDDDNVCSVGDSALSFNCASSDGASLASAVGLCPPARRTESRREDLEASDVSALSTSNSTDLFSAQCSTNSLPRSNPPTPTIVSPSRTNPVLSPNERSAPLPPPTLENHSNSDDSGDFDGESKTTTTVAKPPSGTKRPLIGSNSQADCAKKARSELINLLICTTPSPNVSPSSDRVCTNAIKTLSDDASGPIGLVNAASHKPHSLLPGPASLQPDKKKHQQTSYLGGVSPKPQMQTRTLAQIKAQNQAKRSAKSLMQQRAEDASRTEATALDPCPSASAASPSLSYSSAETTGAKCSTAIISVEACSRTLTCKSSAKVIGQNSTAGNTSLKHKLKIVRVASPSGQVTYKVETCFDSSASNDDEKATESGGSKHPYVKKLSVQKHPERSQSSNLDIYSTNAVADFSTSPATKQAQNNMPCSTSWPSNASKQECAAKEKPPPPQVQARYRPNFQRQPRLLLSEVLSRNAHENSNDCSCNLKGMVICSKCGAFCHNECIGPSRICITCLIAT